MSPSRWAAALAAAALVQAAGAAAAAPALAAAPDAGCPGGIGIGLAEAPAARADDPRARVYVVDHVQPGQSFTRKVRVCNGTAAAVRLGVYPVAASVAASAFVISEGRSANDLTSWTSVSPGQVDLPARSSRTVDVSVRVPGDADHGERYGAVVVELPAAPGAAGISVAHRVGVRMYLSVGTGTEPVSDFRIDSLQASRDAAGNGTVTARVVNTGDRALDLSGSLSLSHDRAGLRAGPFPATVGTTVAPGSSAQVRVPVPDEIREGPWRAVLTLRSGRTERTAAADLTFPTSLARAEPPVPASPVADDPPRSNGAAVAVAAALLLLALLLLALLAAARRLRPQRQALTDTEIDAALRQAAAEPALRR